MYRICLKKLQSLGKYRTMVILIVLFSFFVRFYNFSLRWGLGSDNARDAIIALEALSRHQLPLMGPFSSAGAFVTGGIYYWFVMAAYVIFPFFINAPWILTGLVSVLSVVLLMYLGKILVGERFSILLGILAMLSPQYVGKAIELGNPTFVTVFSILTIIFFVKLWQKNRPIFGFLIGLSIGLGINMHYEAINLLIFLPAVLFIPKLPLKAKVVSFGLVLLGIFVPSIPILYWDAHQGFANTRNILDYLLIGQYRIYVPNNWRLFLFNYFPTYWGKVVGMFFWLGLILFISSGLVFIIASLRKKVTGHLLALGIIFLILLFINKSYKGERTDDYMLYLSPFILIFTAFLIDQLFGFKNVLIKFIGAALLTLIVLISLWNIGNTLSYRNTFPAEENIANTLINKYPNEKFSLYDYRYQNTGYSMPLSLLLRNKNKLDVKGIKIGINCYGKNCPGRAFTILKKPVQIVNINSIAPAKLNERLGLWLNVNAASVYEGQVGWLDKYQLKSPFSLKNYIMGMLGKI